MSQLTVDMSQVLLDLSGEPLTIRTSAEDESVGQFTLGSAAVSALMSELPGDDKMDGGEKFKLYKLASKIKKGGEDVTDLTLNSTQKKLIEDRAAKRFNVLIYGRLYEALEGEQE